jgi:dipeptidase D
MFLAEFRAMSEAVRQLNPSSLWGRFADLNAIPRPSGQEKAVCAWITGLAQKAGLEVESDEVGNVLVRKPATPGMENRKTVVLQSHVDMVCQKNNDTSFDFNTEGIRMWVDGDWVRAEGTTLGADNGLGAATMLAVMEATDIEHPALELLFTIDEETGMTGALELRKGWLKGDILLNLDTEDDREIGIGCAGGVDLAFTLDFGTVSGTEDHGILVEIKGGSGGHSGMDIHKGLANANKILVRVLREMKGPDVTVELAALDGGGLRNAIPREAKATVASSLSASDWQAQLKTLVEGIVAEHKTTDPNLSVHFHQVGAPDQVLAQAHTQALLSALDICPNGIDRMSPDIPGLVQTSNNLARILLEDGRMEAHCLTRSSVDSEKLDLARRIEAGFAMAGLSASRGGAYPGWTPNPSSDVVRMMTELYRELYQEEPLVLACHAGLECGILGSRYPHLDMVSFGPTILGAHSPDERASVSSVAKYWSWFQEALKRIPAQA